MLVVTGKTPQVVTETLYGLSIESTDAKKPWIPHEVHIMSTEDGLAQIHSRLLQEKHFHRMQKDYPQLSEVVFSKEFLHVIVNDQGQALPDLKTPEDNAHAANSICALVQRFTADHHVNLHVSIAGGRKTMGFYAGYALSLYGRSQDRMSHVLVEDKFEFVSDFFYPAPQPHQDFAIVINRQTGQEMRLDMYGAKVWLADIPFVRMRDAILPKHQLNPEHGKKFSDIVNEINQSFEPISLTLFIKNGVRQIQINNEKPVKLSPQYFALLHWFADRKINKNKGIDAPKSNKEDIDKKEQKAFFQEWSNEYNQFYGKQKAKDDVVVDKSYFEITKSKLNKALIDSFGLALTNRIMPMKNSDSNVFEFSKDITIVLIDE